MNAQGADSRQRGEFRRFCKCAAVVIVMSAGVSALGNGVLAAVAAVLCMVGICFVLVPWTATGVFPWTMWRERRRDA